MHDKIVMEERLSEGPDSFGILKVDLRFVAPVVSHTRLTVAPGIGISKVERGGSSKKALRELTMCRMCQGTCLQAPESRVHCCGIAPGLTLANLTPSQHTSDKIFTRKQMDAHQSWHSADA